MGRTYFVVEKVKDSIGSVNGCESTLDSGPFTFTVVRDQGICVLQSSVEDQPAIGNTVRHPIPKNDRHSPELIH